MKKKYVHEVTNLLIITLILIDVSTNFNIMFNVKNECLKNIACKYENQTATWVDCIDKSHEATTLATAQNFYLPYCKEAWRICGIPGGHVPWAK